MGKATLLSTLLFLLAIFTLNIFANGPLDIWPVAWILPVLLILFLRKHGRWFVWLLLGLILGISSSIGNPGVLPLPSPFAELFILFSAYIFLIPFALDRAFRKRIKDFRSTLILPMAMVVLEFIGASLGPWGTWGATANSQIDFLIFAQLASLAGLSAISFIIYWTASSIVYLYDHRDALSSIKRYAITFPTILALVFIYGAYRLASTPDSEGMRSAAVLVSNLDMMKSIYKDHSGKTLEITEKVDQADPEIMLLGPAMLAFIETPDAPGFKSTRDTLRRIENESFELALKAVEEGADLLSWYEGQFFVLESDEARLIGRARAFARQHRLMLFTPMAVLIPGKITAGRQFMKNQIVVINAKGDVEYTYHKAKPVGGVEPVAPGDGLIPVINYNNIRLSPVICYDADFPALLLQTGRKNSDIVVIPSGDWHAIRQVHMNMARFRAIENATNVFRPASRGISAVIDTRGRVLSSMDYFTSEEHLMMADVPTRGDTSIYSRIGDSFAWFCVFTLLFLWGSVFLHKRNPRDNRGGHDSKTISAL